MKLIKTLVSVAIALTISNAYAAADSNATDFPVGLWDTYHYKLNDKTDVTSRTPLHIMVCVQLDGTWQSLKSTDNMGGRWTRVGNTIHLTGNGNNVGGTGNIELTVPYKEMGGDWQSWPLNKPRKAKAHTTYSSQWKLNSTTTCVVP